MTHGDQFLKALVQRVRPLAVGKGKRKKARV
jgi:hypothetical protein